MKHRIFALFLVLVLLVGVLAGCGIDPEIYSGFAFGIGLERMAMRRFKISDMRMIFENDIRFLSQF